MKAGFSLRGSGDLGATKVAGESYLMEILNRVVGFLEEVTYEQTNRQTKDSKKMRGSVMWTIERRPSK